MNKDHEINRMGWNKRTDAHLDHSEYKTREFLDGAVILHPLELAEIGDVSGKTLLHLQCHFGLDTLSLARLGAKVTGVDISDRSIEEARRLSGESNVPGRFIRADLFDLPDLADEQFDIVYSTYGAIWWMSDIRRWAQIIFRHLKEGGFFYLAEVHPVLDMLGEEKNVVEPYFHIGTERFYGEPDYCDKDLTIEEEVGWRWTIGDVVTALADAELHLEFLHEHPFSVYDKYPTMVKDADGWWYYPDRKNDVPLLYSLKATKPLP